MESTIYKATKIFYTLIACVAVGVISNLVMFFLIVFVCAGSDGNTWVRWYFDKGYVFMIISILIAALSYPKIKTFNIVFHK